MWKWTPRPVIRIWVAGTPILPYGHTSFLQRVKDDPSDPNNTTAKPPLRAVVRSPSFLHTQRQTDRQAVKIPRSQAPFCSATVRSRTPGPRRSEAMRHDRARMPLLRPTARRRAESRWDEAMYLTDALREGRVGAVEIFETGQLALLRRWGSAAWEGGDFRTETVRWMFLECWG